jgi:hypothetical protein
MLFSAAPISTLDVWSFSSARHLVRDASTVQSDKQAEGKAGLYWRGRVDGRDLLRLRKDRVWVVHQDGFPIVETDYDLTRPLPTEPITVTVKKVKGRGTVTVAEQPSRENNFTVTIVIEDKKSGSDRYEVEVDW